MMKINNFGSRRGSVLIISYIVVVCLAILGGALLLRSISENNIAQREKQRTQAFYLAQAGVMLALEELRQDYDWPGTAAGVDVHLNLGTYQVSVEASGDNRRRVVASGFIPNSTAFRARRVLEVFVQQVSLSNDFFDYAIYDCGELRINGNAYEVNGDIVHAGDLDGNTDNVTGSVTQDSSISPLARLDFAELREISEEQGYVYDEFRLSTDFLPDSFWHDEANGIPKIVYIETDLVLNGNIDIGGFFVVVGDVVTNPNNTQDATINGVGEIDGCIYTTGEFRVNGGGGGLNVSGGIWAGLEARLNGNVNITYNPEYMDALRNLELSTDVQTLSWREIFP